VVPLKILLLLNPDDDGPTTSKLREPITKRRSVTSVTLELYFYVLCVYIDKLVHDFPVTSKKMLVYSPSPRLLLHASHAALLIQIQRK